MSVITAGFVWGMPSEATSWGKYPAILAMTVCVFIFYSLANQFLKPRRNPFILLIMIGSSIFIHSRMLILVISGIFTLLIIKFLNLDRLKDKYQRTIKICNYSVLTIIGILFLVQIEILKAAFIPFQSVLLIPLILLLPIGMKFYFDKIFEIEIFTLLAVICAVIPMPNFLQDLTTKTLIDRPFLSIFLFIPLSVVLGLNFAGLDKVVRERFGKRIMTGVFLLFWLSANLLPNNRVTEPLPGANFVTTNDLFIYQEIKTQTPLNSKILIPNHSPYYELGLDGGSWISYSTGRETIKISYKETLVSFMTYQSICDAGVQYIYSGSMPLSFSYKQIEQRKEWYRPFIYYPDVKLYQVINCPD